MRKFIRPARARDGGDIPKYPFPFNHPLVEERRNIGQRQGHKNSLLTRQHEIDGHFDAEIVIINTNMVQKEIAEANFQFPLDYP